MDQIHKLKLHEIAHSDDGTFSATRVPGDWIYRFFEMQQELSHDGQWINNYAIDSVFVPFSNEFNVGGKDA